MPDPVIRPLSLLSRLLLTAALFTLLLYEESHEWRAAVTAGSLWLASHYVYNSAVQMRVDMLALAAALFGLYLFWRGYVRRAEERYIWAAMVLFVAAVYARQTCIWAAIACLIYLAAKRRWSLAARATFLYAGLGLAILAALQIMTNGQFARHLVVYNLQKWQMDSWVSAVQRAWSMYPLALLAGGTTLVLATQRRWPALPALYLVLAWLSTLTIGKVGAYINHFLEAAAATALACGLLLGWIAARRRVWWSLVVTAALCAQTALLFHLPYSFMGGMLWPWTAIRPAVRPWIKPSRALYWPTFVAADKQVADVLSQRVDATPGIILSEDGAFTATHGRPMWIQFFDFTQLARSGLWDQTPFLEQIRHHQFALILLKFDVADVPPRVILTPEMIDAIRSSYTLDDHVWFYYVYVPRD